MTRSWFLLAPLAAGLIVAAPAGAGAAGDGFMRYSVYGYSGFSPGGALYINALPMDAEVRLDGALIGVANDLQAGLVDTKAGVTGRAFRHPATNPPPCSSASCRTGRRGSA